MGCYPRGRVGQYIIHINTKYNIIRIIHNTAPLCIIMCSHIFAHTYTHTHGCMLRVPSPRNVALDQDFHQGNVSFLEIVSSSIITYFRKRCSSLVVGAISCSRRGWVRDSRKMGGAGALLARGGAVIVNDRNNTGQ